MKIIIATIIALASFAIADNDRSEGLVLVYVTPSHSVVRDSVPNLKATPKPITFDNFVKIGKPVQVADGLKAELALLPW